MAEIFPFRAYRYTEAAGRLDKLVTQPYDKITREMQARYLDANPHNLVRIILGPGSASDSPANNVYTRAADYLRSWIDSGALAQDAQPSLYAYFQEFQLPDSEERFVRKGFIGLATIEEYEARVVHRHERTLSGPKKDRMELLEHTRAHFGQLFMLYPDPLLEVDRLLNEAAQGEPLGEVVDEYGARHRFWKIADPARIARIQTLMRDKKLAIADGHHRYETALAYRNAHPELEDAKRVMMTFVNMNAPGVCILATHRIVHGLQGIEPAAFPARELGSLDELKKLFAAPSPGEILIGIAFPGNRIYLYRRPRPAGELDVRVLHEELLGRTLGIDENAVREGHNLKYVRGLNAAVARVNAGEAQLAFLLEPSTVEQVAEVAFGGGVMPQKSTDFFPKLLSGFTIFKIEK